MRRIKTLLVLLSFCVGIIVADELPKPQGTLVNDFAGIIPDSTKKSLETELRAYEKLSSIEIAVVTVPSLGDRVVDEYANELFSAWKIGKEGLDNGVLILLAPNEKKWVIRTGYGVEGYLTDAQASHVGRTAVKAHKGDYPAIIRAMVAGIRSELGEFSMEQREEYARKKKEDGDKALEAFGDFLLWTFIILVPIGIIAFFWIRRRTKEEESEELHTFVPPVYIQSNTFEDRSSRRTSRKRSSDSEHTPSRRSDDDDEVHRSSFTDTTPSQDNNDSFSFGGGDTGGGGASGDL